MITDMFWGIRFVATLPEPAGVLTRSTAGGRELGLADRPPAPFNSLSEIQSWKGRELTTGEIGACCRKQARLGNYEIKLATRKKMRF